MAWTKDHDILLCREIVAGNPYKVKPGSRERGELLQKIVDTLNGIQKPSFRIDARCIRDRINKLLAKFIDKQREEERTSGISAEYDELDQLLQEIKDLKEDFEREIAETDEKKRKKLENRLVKYLKPRPQLKSETMARKLSIFFGRKVKGTANTKCKKWTYESRSYCSDKNKKNLAGNKLSC